MRPVLYSGAIEHALVVVDIKATPLSLTDHFLVAIELTGFTDLCKEINPIKSAHPKHRIDPTGCQVAFAESAGWFC